MQFRKGMAAAAASQRASRSCRRTLRRYRQPGVYRMLGERGEVLYVGKARNLKKRVASYTQPAKLPSRLRRMVAETRTMEFVTTHTEVEALLLESNLIKRLKPRYNVLLRDDKIVPVILIHQDHDAGRRSPSTAARASRKGDLFRPVRLGRRGQPHARRAAARLSAALLHRYRLRRRAPGRACCYQIKRCSAPCVGRIGPTTMPRSSSRRIDFLTGRSRSCQRDLANEMHAASDGAGFRAGGHLRDRIRALTTSRRTRTINAEGSRRPTSSPRTRKAARPASRCSSSAPAELRQPRLFPAPRPRTVDAGRARRLHRPVLRQQVPPPLVLLSTIRSRAALIAEALSLSMPAAR